MKYNLLKKIVRWTIAVLCLAYIVIFFWRQREHLELAFSLNIFSILSLMALLFSYHLLRSYRYLLILKKCSSTSIPYWPWYRIYILGMFLNKFVPQMGNIYRSVRLKKDHQVTYTSYITTYLSFAWMDTCLNMVIAMSVVMIAEPDLQISGINAVVLLGSSAVIIAVAPILLLYLSRLIESKIQRMLWLHAKLAEVFEVTVGNLQDLQYVWNVIILGLIAFIQMCTLFYVCFKCLGLQITLPAITLFYALYKISTHFNITPGNIGIRELAYGILSELMNAGMAEGILASAIIRVLSYIVLSSLAVPMGGLDLLRSGEEYRPKESKQSESPS